MNRKTFFLISIIFGTVLVILILTLIFVLRGNRSTSSNTPSSPRGDNVIADFENPNDWQGEGIIDQAHVSGGKGALKLTSTGFDWKAQSSSSVNLNLASFKDSNLKMVINVFVDDASKISGIRLDLGDNASNFYFAAEQTKGFYKDGWNTVTFKPSAFYDQGPTGWHSITYIRVNLAANKDSIVNVWVDDWQIIDSKTPLPTPSSSEKQKNITNAKEPTNKGGIMTNNLFWILGILLIIIIAVWVILWLLKIRKRQQTDEEERQFSFWKKKLNWPTIWIAIGLAIAIAVGLSFYLCPSTPSSPSETKTTSTPEATTQEKSDKWEYQVVTFTIPKQTNEAIETELNALGDKGWELVSQSTISTGKTGEYYLYLTLKKPL